ncbi:hypothetical protein ACQ4PT_037950 [Festuca glaucescens]
MAATEPAKDPSGSGLDSNASASGKASESVEEMMGNLKLTAAEADKLIIDDEEEEVVKPLWALAGKILAPKIFHYNTIAEALRSAWGNPKGLVFRDGGPNLFIAEFGCERDRDRVWERSPWTVSKFAVVLEAFDGSRYPMDMVFDKLLIWIRVLNLPYNKMNAEWGEKIARKCGEFVRLDTNKEGHVVGRFLRARTFMKVNEPIQRWVGLDSVRLKKTFWYDIQYEFLPYFCFSCGLLGHSFVTCPTPAERDEEGKLPWSPALRAPHEKKKINGPPFAEGGYADFSYEVQENEVFEADDSGVEQNGKTVPPKNSEPVRQPMGRGGGRAPFARGGRHNTVNRGLFWQQTSPTDTDKALTIYDPRIAGSKREGTTRNVNNKGGVTPDPKKKKVAPTHASSSARAAEQPRPDQ